MQHFQRDIRQDQWSKLLFKYQLQKTEGTGERAGELGKELPDTKVLSFDFILSLCQSTMQTSFWG